jgi:hypothetical protein
MRKRIQKYQSSGVLTGGSNLTPPLPQPASLTSMIQTPSFPTTLELPDSVKQWNQNQASKIQRAYTKKANLNKGFGIAGSIADVAGSLIPKTEQSALTEGLNQGYDAAANAAMAIPGVGTIIGGAMKVGGMLSDGLTALGVGTDQMTTADKILDSKFLKLTPLGLVNAIGAKKADTITKDNEAFEQVGSSYGGTQATVDDALTKSGKKYGLLSGKARNKANQQIHNAQMQQSKMSNIADEAQMAFTASNNPLIGLGTQLQLNGGYQQSTVRAGKSGLKMDREFAKRVIKLSNGKKSKAKKIQEEVRMEEVAGFKNGGAVNVIPDGALHAHKHHLEDVDGKFEEVTTKGIPVITEEKGGDIKQHAEVEREEIIFNLDVTKQLEKLMQDGSDEAAIEAGKLLVHEILENTVDNTGLLKTVE